jgi:hypothetical protein
MPRSAEARAGGALLAHLLAENRPVATETLIAEIGEPVAFDALASLEAVGLLEQADGRVRLTRAAVTFDEWTGV